jgi:carbamoyl-phosphate synthase large subunit
LAFVAAKLGLGYGLFELKNSVTKTTSAFFEPALDYVVCKIPRWDLGKFRGVDRELGSSMKSVGEVMAIGRTFEEAIQKGLRMIGQGMHGFVENKELQIDDIDAALHEPTDKRIFIISKAMQQGYTIDRIHELTKIDKWFLQKLHNIKDTSKALHACKSINVMDNDLLRRAKVQGFTDFQIARALGMEEEMDIEEASLIVRRRRLSAGIVPVVKQIDTLAAEYPAQTNYLYMTYSGIAHDIHYEHDKRSIVVLGSGAYRIGSSVEFDWCGVQALNTIRKEGFRSVMIQSRNGIYRLRHVRPPLFRRTDFRARVGYSGLGMSERGYRFYGRTNPEQPGHPFGPAAYSYSRHDGQEHRQCGRP